MDETLNAMFKPGSSDRKMIINASTGTIRLVDDNDQPGEPYAVKPLADLYDKSSDAAPTADRNFMGLLLAIEETFISASKLDPALTDGQILSTLDRLCMSPEADMRGDPLAIQVQFSLRVGLSIGDYSRQDVRHCLRKVKQSVARHNKLGGPRGYLTFIRKALRQ